MSFKVSTSEVATYLTCKQRWKYAHHPSYNLEPRTLGVALTRGLIGHEALEIYYKGIQEGKSSDDSASASISFIMDKSLEAMSQGDSAKARMIANLGTLVQDYFQESKWILDKYNIKGVEYLVTTPLPGVSDIEFAGRIDLVLEVPSGPYKGELIPWDHKFTYNFWPEAAIKMNVQLPNYVWALREMGFHSRKGVISMLRYRENAQEVFKQEEVPTKSAMRDVFIHNHVIAAKEIVNLKQKPKVDVSDGITRSVSKFNCEYCPFSTLCYTEATGEDSTTMIKASYRANSYGYDSELDVS